MINNRQGGRRRGRGGQRGQNLGGQPGNRQDSRQRGNATQLLEKYKNMARDAQLAGDRVQMEYYLQYADHYFRVLSESRSRFEDQRRQRDDDLDDDEGDEEMVEAGEDQASPADMRRERPERGDRGERYPRRNRERRPSDDDERSAHEGGDRSDERRRMNGDGGETIAFDVLPPAIGAEEADDGAEEAPRPRRGRRRAAPEVEEGDGEIAPAA